MSEFNMLEEFQGIANQGKADKTLTVMASAKWQAPLVSAIIQSGNSDLDIASVCKSLGTTADYICQSLNIDNDDPVTKNFVLQAISPFAAQAIEKTGAITGDWVASYIESIKHLPASHQALANPSSPASSLAMTRATHLSKLFCMANEFSFLQQPHDVVMAADSVISKAAQKNADKLAPHGDTTAVYQNQLNSLRSIYISIYKAEAQKHWMPMLEKEPDFRNLFVDGIPLDGVHERFHEQVQNLNAHLGVEPHPKSITRSM